MRRLLAIMLMLTAATIVAAGTLSAEGKKVKIRLEVPPKGSRGLLDVSDRAVLDAFLAAHPEIEVDPYVKLRVPGPRGEATIFMAMAGDTAPDALYVYGRSTLKYIDQGFLYPLDDYLKETPDITGDPLFEKFLPAISGVDPKTGQEHVYVVTDKVYVHGLLYRKDLFTEVGLDPNRPPKNWDELLEYARKLTIPARGQYGITLPGAQGASWRFANFVWQAGGEVCRQDANGNWRLSVDEKEAVDAFKFYREMVWGKWERDGKTLTGCMKVESAGQEMNHFVEGRAAMTIVSTRGDVGRYLQSGLDPSQVGLAPLPAGPAKKASMLEGEFWGINALIAHDKARRDATWKYIKFVTGKEARRIRTKTYVEAGWAISVNPKWLKEFGYETELRQIPREWVDLYDSIVEHGELEPYAPAYAQVATDVMAKMDLVLRNEAGDPETVAKEIAKEANTRFFGKEREENIAKYRNVGRAVFAVIMGLAAMIAGWAILRWIRKRRAEAELHRSLLTGVETPSKRALQRKMELLAWVFMLPAILTILIWAYYPLASGARLAFMDYRIIQDNSFIGLDNFIEALTLKAFWQSFLQTGIYAGMSLAVGFLMPIFLALLLNEIPRFRMFFRTVYYLPAITSGLVVMFIWKLMYDNSPQGIFNQGLTFATGTTIGRAIVIVGVLVLWAMVLSLFIGIIARIMHHVQAKGPLVPLVLLLIAAPFVLDMLGDIVGGVTQLARSDILADLHGVRRLVALTGAGTPLAILMNAILRGAAVLLLLTGLFVLIRLDHTPTRREVTRLSILAMVPAMLAFAVTMNALIQPMARHYPWLDDSNGYWAMLWVIVPGIWAGMGPGCIIYLAALKSIPEDLYEAADVDGAGPLEKAYHVTFQYLKPLIIINFVGAFVGTFHAMQNILVMTGGGPGDKTMTIGMDIFFNAFTHLKFGYATAEAWILGSLLIGFTLYQLRILKKLRFTRAEN